RRPGRPWRHRCRRHGHDRVERTTCGTSWVGIDAGGAHPCSAALEADRLLGLLAGVRDEAATRAHPRPVTTRGGTACRLVFPCYDPSFYARLPDTMGSQGVSSASESR